MFQRADISWLRFREDNNAAARWSPSLPNTGGSALPPPVTATRSKRKPRVSVSHWIPTTARCSACAPDPRLRAAVWGEKGRGSRSRRGSSSRGDRAALFLRPPPPPSGSRRHMYVRRPYPSLARSPAAEPLYCSIYSSSVLIRCFCRAPFSWVFLFLSPTSEIRSCGAGGALIRMVQRSGIAHGHDWSRTSRSDISHPRSCSVTPFPVCRRSRPASRSGEKTRFFVGFQRNSLFLCVGAPVFAVSLSV